MQAELGYVQLQLDAFGERKAQLVAQIRAGEAAWQALQQAAKTP